MVASFIRQSLYEENISQYKPKGSHLIKELLQFAQDFKDDEDDPNILEKIKHIALNLNATKEDLLTIESEQERLVKMFYLHMRVQGKLNPLKEDYFV